MIDPIVKQFMYSLRGPILFGSTTTNVSEIITKKIMVLMAYNERLKLGCKIIFSFKNLLFRRFWSFNLFQASIFCSFRPLLFFEKRQFLQHWDTNSKGFVVKTLEVIH